MALTEIFSQKCQFSQKSSFRRLIVTWLSSKKTLPKSRILWHTENTPKYAEVQTISILTATVHEISNKISSTYAISRKPTIPDGIRNSRNP